MVTCTLAFISKYILSSPNLLASYGLLFQWLLALSASSIFFFFFFNEHSSKLKFPFLYWIVLVARRKLAYLVKASPKQIHCIHSGSQFFDNANLSTFHSTSNICFTHLPPPLVILGTNHSDKLRSHQFNTSGVNLLIKGKPQMTKCLNNPQPGNAHTAITREPSLSM